MAKATAVILAAGIGSRLGSLTRTTPKPLIKIGNRSLLEHQIQLLCTYGFRHILIVTGYLEQKIKQAARKWYHYGTQLHFVNAQPLGTVFALYKVKDIVDENFILLYGDIMMMVDLNKIYSFHKKNKADMTIVSHRSDHPNDSDLLNIDKNNTLQSVIPRQKIKPGEPYSAAGVFILSSSVLFHLQSFIQYDIVQDFIPYLLRKTNAKIKIYKTKEFMKDIGTPRRLKEVRSYYTKNFLQISARQSAVSIDRNGTLIKEKNLLYKIHK